MTVQDLGTMIANETALEQENLTKLIVALTQGTLQMESVFPVKPSTDAFIWHTEKDTTEYNIPSPVGEKAEAENNAIEYEKHTDSVLDFRQKMEFSEKELRNGNVYSFVDPVQRAALAISRKLKLAVENDAVLAATNTTMYTSINTEAGSAVWTTPTASKPIDDIYNGKYKIRDAMQMDADTIILGSTEYKNLMLSSQIRDANQYTRDVVGDLVIEKICGLKIIVSDAQYANSAGTLTKLLSGTGILIASGLAGNIYESVPLTADREYIKSNETLIIYAKRSFKTIITQPKLICLLTSLA
jgi:hypothetical protein